MVRVLVFPSCNEPGLEVINALMKSNKVMLWGGSSYATDYDPSRLLLKHFIQCPDFYDPDFKAKFLKILSDHQIDVVFPTMDILVAEFAKWRVPNTTFITTNAEAAELFLSKAQTYERLKDIIPVPEIYHDLPAAFPAYAKPDKGSGSRGHMLITNQEEWALAVKKQLLMCEYLPGQEYTVDCINDTEGKLLFSNARVRGFIGRGIALGTKSVSCPEIDEYIQQIARTIKIEGPWFAQFKESKAGQPKLMEINARVAGSMALTRLLGVNIPLMAVFLWQGYQVEVPKFKPHVLLNRSLRNLSESAPFTWVLWDLDDTLIRKDGKPDPDIIACLYDYHNRGVKQLLITKNVEAEAVLKRHKIPDFFTEVRVTQDKLAELHQLIPAQRICIEACVMINDSYTENLAIQKSYPALRILTPDAVDLLGRETL